MIFEVSKNLINICILAQKRSNLGFVDMFAESLQELVAAGQSVTIDEIGEFKSTPLFPNGLNHRNNIRSLA